MHTASYAQSTTTRRKFLQSTFGRIAALALPTLSRGATEIAPLSRTSPRKRVIVIGAGLGGLSAAFELKEAGHDVTLLEASGVPGGRVRTLRNPLDDGLYAELGGQAFYPVAPNYAAHYADRFGLKRESGAQRGLEGVHYFNGTLIRSRPNQAITWPIPLTVEEQRLGLAGMRRTYLEPLLDELAALIGPEGWTPEAIEKFDRASFAELLQKRGASPAATELLRIQDRDFVGEGAEHYSAVDMLGQVFNVRAASRNLTKDPFFSLAGGNDLLPRAFAAQLGEKVIYEAPVVGIEQSEKTILIRYENGGQRKTVTGDFAVCAIPFTILRSVDVSPAFSSGKQQAIRELSATSLARTYIQCRERFWRSEGLSGSAATDLPTTYFWESTDRQPGPRGVLHGYIMGPHSRRFRTLSRKERDAFAIEQARKVFPKVEDFVEKVTSISWDEEPWSRGDYAWLRPGDAKKLWPHLATPEGRVHFAGEHTSTWFLHASMQGAIESGLRAAKAINALAS